MDRQIFDAIHLGWHSQFADYFFLLFSYSGLGQVGAIIALLLLLSKKHKIFAVPIVISVVLTGTLLAQGAKALMPRDRPSNLSYAKPQEGHKKSSFPSGHTTTAFAIATTATLIARRKKSWTAPVLLYSWAIGVGISRIYRGVHWPTDVMAGACLGIMGACLLHLVHLKINWVDRFET